MRRICVVVVLLCGHVHVAVGQDLDMFTVEAGGVVSSRTTACVRNEGKTLEVSTTSVAEDEQGRGFADVSFGDELIWDNVRFKTGMNRRVMSNGFIVAFWDRMDGTLRLDGCEYRVDWLQIDIRDQVIGDSTGDGVFDSSDLVAMFRAGKYDDGIFYNTELIEGDWDLMDREFDSSDMVFLFQQGDYKSGAEAATVPEPTGFGLVLIGIVSLAQVRGAPDAKRR